MATITRRTLYYVVLVLVTTTVLTLVYNAGMAVLEGRPQSLFRSLEIVVQSFTTTGYGEDAPWQTPQMNLLVIGIQLAGIGLILTAADVFAVPWLRNALSPTAPTTAPDLTDHVVVTEFTPRTESFIDELDSRGREYLAVESDEAVATDYYQAGYDVLHGDPESPDVLREAGVESARAVVVDAPDDATASIVLTVRDVNPDVRVVTLVEDRDLLTYLEVAGADEVLSPRQLLGESIASEVPTAVTTLVDDEVDLGEDLQLVEVGVASGSPLCDQSFGEARLHPRFDVDVVGAWIDGEFESPPPPTAEIDPGVRLLVAGPPDHIDALRSEAAETIHPIAHQRVVIAGYGESGQAAASAFESTTTTVRVLDVADRPGVDVVGDARDPEVLEQVGIQNASALVVTVADDTTAILTTLIARDRNPDLRILVRAEDEADVTKLYRAGGDFVQSLARVSGRMLASTVFADEEVFAPDKQVSVVKLPAGDLAGRTVADAAVRSQTGVTVIAVVRDSEAHTGFDPRTFTVEDGDDLVLAGTDESVRQFETTFVS